MEDHQRISTWQYTTVAGEVRADVAWINYVRKAFDFSGRATRAEYNWPLAMIAVVWVVVGVTVQTFVSNTAVLRSIAAVLFLLVAWPWPALIARRCHDINRRGAFGLLMLVPGVGFAVASAFMILADSDPRGARFDSPAGSAK